MDILILLKLKLRYMNNILVFYLFTTKIRNLPHDYLKIRYVNNFQDDKCILVLFCLIMLKLNSVKRVS